MVWNNQPLALYHGTDTGALGTSPNTMKTLVGRTLGTFAANLAKCRPNTDFGRAFYMTSNAFQAKEWANNRVRQVRNAAVHQVPDATAVLLRFDIERWPLAAIVTLCFIRPTDDFHDFVDNCRNGHPHDPVAGKADYDVVYGPVRMWPQRLVIFDADQISFNTQAAIDLLAQPKVVAMARDPTGCF